MFTLASVPIPSGVPCMHVHVLLLSSFLPNRHLVRAYDTSSNRKVGFSHQKPSFLSPWLQAPTMLKEVHDSGCTQEGLFIQTSP